MDSLGGDVQLLGNLGRFKTVAGPLHDFPLVTLKEGEVALPLVFELVDAKHVVGGSAIAFLTDQTLVIGVNLLPTNDAAKEVVALVEHDSRNPGLDGATSGIVLYRELFCHFLYHKADKVVNVVLSHRATALMGIKAGHRADEIQNLRIGESLSRISKWQGMMAIHGCGCPLEDSELLPAFVITTRCAASCHSIA